jgi:hypothetical protein
VRHTGDHHDDDRGTDHDQHDGEHDYDDDRGHDHDDHRGADHDDFDDDDHDRAAVGRVCLAVVGVGRVRRAAVGGAAPDLVDARVSGGPLMSLSGALLGLVVTLTLTARVAVWVGRLVLS